MARIMASVAAYEVEVLTEKQKAGIAAAQEAVKDGERVWFKNGEPRRKPRKLNAATVASIKKLVGAGEPIAQVASVLGMSRKTVYVALGRM
jgi:DNA invertase Pin-like site-specific DNA recombinase